MAGFFNPRRFGWSNHLLQAKEGRKDEATVPSFSLLRGLIWHWKALRLFLGCKHTLLSLHSFLLILRLRNRGATVLLKHLRTYERPCSFVKVTIYWLDVIKSSGVGPVNLRMPCRGEWYSIAPPYSLYESAQLVLVSSDTQLLCTYRISLTSV